MDCFERVSLPWYLMLHGYPAREQVLFWGIDRKPKLDQSAVSKVTSNAMKPIPLISCSKLKLKHLGSVRFFMFFKGVSSAHQGCIYSIKNTEKKL